MSLSWQFHGSFMALSHTSLTWVQSAKIYWKSYPKSRSWLSICFFCLISASFLALCQIHVGFMALSWHFHGAFFLLIFIVFPNSFMALACQIHGRFIADSSRIHASFFQSQKIKIMSDSCHFHGSFMALSHTSLTWVQSAKIYWKKLSKKSVLVVDLFFLPNFSFIFGNMSDSCRFHGPFMALSTFWFYFFPEKNPHQQLNPSQKWLSSLNVRFIANSSRIHGAFISLSWHFLVSFTAMSDSSRIHVTSTAVPWHFHIQALPGYSLPKSIGKIIQKVGVGCRFVFLPNFSFIFGTMSDSCRFHGPFMALSWRFLPLDFYCFSKQFHGTCMADSWQIHGTFMALSWHFPGTFLALFPLGMFGFAMKMPWKCHESAKPRWNLHVRFMSICVCLFLSICRQCFFLMLFSLMVFEVEVDQFFLGFSLIKI